MSARTAPPALPRSSACSAPATGSPWRPTGVYLGRDRSRAAVLNLYDPNGKPRIRLKVDSLGAASLEFLDEQGGVTARFPDRKP